MTALMDRQVNREDGDERRRELVSLLAAIERGDRPALRALYDRTRAKLYGICLRVLGDEAEAQDVLQDVFTTVWSKAGRFDAAKASAITWLSVLARNRAIDRLRARREPAAPLDQAAEVASADPSQFDVLQQAQDRDRLMHCLEELDERARTMIRAAFLDGATYPQLAKRADVPLPTMKSWIRRGLQRLRGCLDR